MIGRESSKYSEAAKNPISINNNNPIAKTSSSTTTPCAAPKFAPEQNSMKRKQNTMNDAMKKVDKKIKKKKWTNPLVRKAFSTATFKYNMACKKSMSM